MSKQAKVSDYARSKRCVMSTNSSYYGNGNWWLRSPYSNFAYGARVVTNDGIIDNGYGDAGQVNISAIGVRAACTINL